MTPMGVRAALGSVRDIFFLGAGASYGSGDCLPGPPPLGGQLFEALREKGGIAATVTGDLRTLFETDFEAGMEEFAKTRNIDLIEFLRDMGSFFAEYEPGPENEYFNLVRRIQKRKLSPTFVTLNYETLLEFAISRSGIRVKYGKATAHRGRWPVLKIHGSCNFLPNPGSNELRGVRFADFAGGVVDMPLKIGTKAEVLAFCSVEDSLAPAIAIYGPGKKVLVNQYAVKHYREVWLQLASAARRIFVIGVRVAPADDHIWNTFASCKAELLYLGHEPDVFLRWAADNSRSGVEVLARDFKEAIPLIR